MITAGAIGGDSSSRRRLGSRRNRARPRSPTRGGRAARRCSSASRRRRPNAAAHLAVDVEGLRVAVHLGVAAGRHQQRDHRGAGRDHVAADLHVLDRHPPDGVRRPRVAQELLHRAASLRRVGLQLLALRAIVRLQQVEETAGQSRGCGPVSRVEHQHRVGRQLMCRHRRTRVEQRGKRAEQVVAGADPLGLDEAGEVLLDQAGGLDPLLQRRPVNHRGPP
jgi:hypothetical protein